MSEMTRRNKIHPLVAIAAIAIILFSAVGVAMMTGLIPSSKSSPEEAAVVSQGSSSTTTTRQRSSNNSAQTKPAESRQPGVESRPPAVAAAPTCADCGVIESVRAVESKGEGSGLGAAGGAVVGGLIGNQVGSGRGNTAATIVGAVGGAVAGNEVEKRVKKTSQYNVAVRMDNGETRTFTYANAPGYAVGEKVKVVDGKLVKA